MVAALSWAAISRLGADQQQLPSLCYQRHSLTGGVDDSTGWRDKLSWPHSARLRCCCCATGAAAAAPAATTAPDLVLIDQESFYPTLEAAGDRLVVVDFYTAW